MSIKVATVGAGSWGTAVANVFADAGCESRLWGRDAEVLRAVRSRHENPKYLSGLSLNPALNAVSSLEEALTDVDLVVCSLPVQKTRQVLAPVADLLRGKKVLNTSKGVEMGTQMRMSEIVNAVCPEAEYLVLSGPSFAQEVVQKQPTAVTVAGRNKDTAAWVQRTLATGYFRVYTTTDVVGVELAGSLKNVVALATGIVRGARLGHNAQAAVITRGLAEIVRMGRKCGADPATFLGLAGMGDLVLTCTGPLSRNLRAGILIGEGHPLEKVGQALGGVVEGIYTAQSAQELAAAHGLSMPILEEVHAILYEGKTPQNAITSLMTRDLKEENA